MSRAASSAPGLPVLLVSPLPPPPGGMATWTRIALEEGFCKGYQPVVIDTSVSQRRGSPVEKGRLFDELERNLRILSAFTFAFLRHRPVLVHINSSMSPRGIVRELLMAMVARVLRCPVIVQYHCAFPERAGLGLGRPGRWVLQRLVRLANANLVLSPSFLREVERAGGGPADRALPNFIDRRMLERPGVDRSDRVGKTRVIYVGAMIPAKGSHELVEIARRLPDLEFRALGLLPSDERLEAPGNLELAGSQSHERILAELDSADVLLFPSHSEGFPYAVLEAMAARLPVVASNVGAIPEMIDDGRGGFLRAPGDVDGLCAALALVARNPELRLRMGEHNRARVESDYTAARVLTQLAQIYAEVRATSR